MQQRVFETEIFVFHAVWFGIVFKVENLSII